MLYHGRISQSSDVDEILYKIKLFIIYSILIAAQINFALALDSFTYDSNGNLIGQPGFTLTYNNANQLSRVANSTNGSIIAEYFYDADGQRVKKIEGGITTYYIGGYVETTVSGSTANTTSNYFANGERIARRDPNGSLYYYHNDHLGSANIVTIVNGSLSEKISYYPFGAIKDRTGNGSRYLFTGKEYDANLGLYYFGARYYNPQLTRFAQPDPFIQELYDPQYLNAYSYARSNPQKYIDPSGKMDIPILSEMSETLDKLTEKYLPGLASHNQNMRTMLKTNPEQLWEAGSQDIGPIHFKPGAFAQKMYEDPLGFFCIIGEGAVDAYSLGAGNKVKQAIKVGFFSGGTKEFLKQTDEGNYNAVEIIKSATVSAGTSAVAAGIMKSARMEKFVMNSKTIPNTRLRMATDVDLRIVTRNHGDFVTWSGAKSSMDYVKYLSVEYANDLYSQYETVTG